MACFAGPREGHDETGIWGALYKNEAWCEVRQIVDSKRDHGGRSPLWNPVLCFVDDELRLYYQFGKSPERWRCAYVSSFDNSQTWSGKTALPVSTTGPVRNKPLLLERGKMITPTSTEQGAWAIHFELSDVSGEACNRVNVQHNDIQAIQPVILQHPEGVLQALCRTRNRYLAESWSRDNGLSWSELALTGLRNPNAAIDAIRVNNLGYLLVFNDSSRDRCNLTVATSTDGREWVNQVVLENALGEFSYPSIEVGHDGSIHVLYTYNRKNIKHVKISKVEVDQLF